MSRTLHTFAVLSLVALALALAAGASLAAANPSGELLLNPGFEDSLEAHPWMPSGWDTSQTSLPTVFFGRDTFLVHGGRYSVSIAKTSMFVPVWHNWNQTLLVGPESWGKDLVLSVWTRSNGLQGRAYVLLQAYRDTIGKMSKVWGIPRELAGKRLGINKIDDPHLDLGWKRAYFSEPETDWVRREVRVFVPRGTNVIYVRCGLAGTGQVVFDDASLRLEVARPAPAPPSRVNLLADPGFEGDGNDWEYSMPPYAGMRIDQDTTVVHSGKASLRCTPTNEGLFGARAGACQVFGRGLAGKRLRLSAWLKTDSLMGGLASIRLYANSLSRGMVQSDPTQRLDRTNDWSPLSVEMDVPEDAAEVWAWLAFTPPSTGMLWYDDASLEVLGPSSKARTAGTATRPAAKTPAAPAARKGSAR
jgi:hypothetical protein